MKTSTVEVEEQKTETEWVLVDTVGTFNFRYCVEVPKGKTEWALDTVTMEEAQEMSQRFIGENITCHRTIAREEALAIFNKENSYLTNLSEEEKIKIFFTPWKNKQE